MPDFFPQLRRGQMAYLALSELQLMMKDLEDAGPNCFNPFRYARLVQLREHYVNEIHTLPVVEELRCRMWLQKSEQELLKEQRS